MYSVVSVSGTLNFPNKKSVVDESALFASSQPHDTEPDKGKSEGEGGSEGGKGGRECGSEDGSEDGSKGGGESGAGGRKVEEIDVTE